MATDAPTSPATATEQNGWYPVHPAEPPSDSPWARDHDSLQRRIRGMHALWLEALDTMGSEHVNHFERSGVLPIAFTVNHAVRMEDAVTILLRGEMPLWVTGQWAERAEVAIDDIGKETTVEEMEGQRIGNYPVFVEYAHEVFAGTEQWLAGMDPDRLGEVMFDGTYPDFIKNAYIHRVVRDDTVLISDAIECWIFQHGIRHLGELEHARALVGLGGLTS